MAKLAQTKRSSIQHEEPRFTRTDVVQAMVVTLVIFIAGMLAQKLGL
jgi:hypothetical protein